MDADSQHFTLLALLNGVLNLHDYNVLSAVSCVGPNFKTLVTPLVKHVRLHLIDAQDMMQVHVIIVCMGALLVLPSCFTWFCTLWGSC